MCLITLFCNIDDFCNKFEPKWNKQLLTNGEKKRSRLRQLSLSEMITIIVLFHQSCYRTFKSFYLERVLKYLQKEFPQLVSYPRFIALMPSVLGPLCAYAIFNKGKATGISFIDSTPIMVCHNIRIERNKVFSGLVARDKHSMGWFYGFKLHLVANDLGEILAFCVTPGNTDDRKPLLKLTKKLTGKLFGDRGYISKKYFTALLKQGVRLITSIKSNMKNRLMPIMDKVLLHKRFIIETINDQLKNISQIEHSRHRSVFNFMVNLTSGLIYASRKETILKALHERKSATYSYFLVTAYP